MADSLFKVTSDDIGNMVAVGGNGRIITSDDYGVTWYTRDSGTANGLYGITWGVILEEKRWVAVGQNGIVLVSEDTITWTPSDAFTSSDIYDAEYLGGGIAVVGSEGLLAYSNDLGLTWALKSTGVTADLYDISSDGIIYTITGSEDTIIVGQLAVLQSEVVVEDGVGVGAAMDMTGVFNHTILQSLISEDSTGDLFKERITDGLFLFDDESTSSTTIENIVTELVDTLSIFAAISLLDDVVVEAPTITDTVIDIRGRLASVVESLLLNDTISVTEACFIAERLGITSAATSIGTFNHVLTDRVSIKARVILSYLATVLESVTASDEVLSNRELVVKVVDRIAGTTSVDARLAATAQAVVAVELFDEIQGGKGADAIESILTSGALTIELLARIAQLESIVVEATVSAGLVVTAPALEDIEVTDELTPSAVLQGLLDDGVAFQISFGGDYEWSGWVMNTETFAVTEYTNYPFNSFARIGGNYYGANENGLYLLDGDTDDGEAISAQVLLGKTDFGRRQKGAIRDAWMALKADGDIYLKVITDDERTHWYRTTTLTDELDRVRLKLSRGVVSNFWQFGIENIDGSDFELAELELVHIALSRH